MTTPVRSVTRRAVLGMIVASAVSPALAAADRSSLVYMKQVAKDLLNANRMGTVASFRRAIQRHADVGDIAIYSLGPYKGKLPETQRHRYYGGVATFMARYFADQSREYRIAKYELGEPAAAGDGDMLIPSKVYLMTGQTYTVSWRLAKRGGRYKIVDAKMLGFSLVYLQRNLFTSFLSKRNGDVGQLVAALNR
jgi:phospholipid transport system substrate-binding protein